MWFAIWIPWNLGWFGLREFDPYPFGLLTMIVSLEAIFLSIFVLMAQKRESAIAELREELALQVSLRIEEENHEDAAARRRALYATRTSCR